MENTFNPTDKLTLDVPLFIRLLEYAKEDAKTDMDLHTATEKAFGPELGQQYKMVNADYRAYSDLWDKPGAEVLLAPMRCPS